MTKLSMEGPLAHSAGKALEPHQPDFATRPMHTLVGIAELRRVKITTVDDGTGEDAVKIRLLTFEPAPGEAAHRLREASLALRALRTAEGTLTGDLDAEIAEQTLEHLGGMIGMEEAARLKIGVKHYLDVLNAAVARPIGQLKTEDLADDIKLVTMGLSAVLAGVSEPGERAADDDPRQDGPDLFDAAGSGAPPDGWDQVDGGPEGTSDDERGNENDGGDGD
jgi:hypothetical protein